MTFMEATAASMRLAEPDACDEALPRSGETGRGRIEVGPKCSPQNIQYTATS